MNVSLRQQLRGARDELFPRDGAGCAKKARYVDCREANKVIDKRRRDDPKSPQLRAYGCDKCGGWHLTKQV